MGFIRSIDDFFTIASEPIINIIINNNNGWFIRILHVIVASLSILFTYFHFIRAILIIKLKIIYSQFITFIIIIIGQIIPVLPMIEGFLGHLFIWGQMPYWGITVMINIVAVLPCYGIVIAELMRSAAWVISNRIFVGHFLIGILISLFILIYILLPHNFPSINPSINNNKLNKELIVGIQ